MTSPTDPKAVVRDAFDALDDRDRDAFARLHADDVVLHGPHDPIRGVDDLVDDEFAYFEGFPDLTFTIRSLIAEDDLVAARWRATGTHDGVFAGIDPTGNPVDIVVMGTFRVADGEIAEGWILSDRLGLLDQLDAVTVAGD